MVAARPGPPWERVDEQGNVVAVGAPAGDDAARTHTVNADGPLIMQGDMGSTTYRN